jgi:2-keto-3-deoxy-L-rhamnonate aldolase RhmA
MSFLACKPDALPAIGCTLGFGNLLSAQLIARVGYNYVLIDMEHNPISAREAGLMAHVVISASAGRCKTIIRVPSHGVEWIKWALDCGSHGILVPTVKNRKEMEAIVQSAVYPPVGQRSFGPTMAAFADLDPGATNMKYFMETSKEVAVIPMIESVEGLENAEAICSVEGVTAVFIGPVDLRLSMGLAGGDGSEEVFLKALQKVLQIGKKLGIPVGTFASDGEACRKRTADGFDFIMARSPFDFALSVANGTPGSWRSCIINCRGKGKFG